MQIRATLELGGKTATGIRIPPEVVDALGAGKRPPVSVTINGYTYRSSIAVMSGTYMLGVSADVRERTGVKAGDIIDADIQLDTAPRAVAVPEDLAARLAEDAAARAFFERLSPSQKQWFVLSVEGAKTAETRERRLDKAMEMLHAGRKP
jgi:Bacteriocin-protection, YdeI or OmpD-Associated/Domain of unknown function (DUF1905)